MKGFIMKLSKRPAAKDPVTTTSPDPNALTIFSDEQLCADNGIDPDTNEGVISGGPKGCADLDDTDSDDTDASDDDQEDAE